MRLDSYYSVAEICPVTGQHISKLRKIFLQEGCCPSCKEPDRNGVSHLFYSVGRWSRPSLGEWLMGYTKEWKPAQDTKL